MSQSTPSLFSRLLRATFYSRRSFVRAGVWSILLILALIAGTWAAYGLGFLTYKSQDDKQDWQGLQRKSMASLMTQMNSRQTQNDLTAAPYEIMLIKNEDTFLAAMNLNRLITTTEKSMEDFTQILSDDLPVFLESLDIPESRIDWADDELTRRESNYVIRYSFDPIDYWTNEAGEVVGYQYSSGGFPPTSASSYMLRSTTRILTPSPDYATTPILPNSSVSETMVYKIDDGQLMAIFEWQPHDPNLREGADRTNIEFSMTTTVISQDHPKWEYFDKLILENKEPIDDTGL